MKLRLFSHSSFAFVVLAIFVLTLNSAIAQASDGIPLVNQPLVPASVTPGSSSLTLTVNGTGFVSTSVVNWNGIPLNTTFVNSHRLTADVPNSALVSAGTASVTVSSPAPIGGTSNAVPFAIVTPTESVAFGRPISAESSGGSFVVADFNNDGKADLAVVTNEPDPTCYTAGHDNVGTISILLGNGDATFSKKSTVCFPQIGLGDFPGMQIVAGDFNGDGKTDLIGTYYDEGLWTVVSFLGNGDGTFSISNGLGYFDEIHGIVAGDFNHDGDLDLAFPVLAIDAQFVFVALGNGDGSFGGCCSSGYLSGVSLVTGDFDNDGFLDLAVVGVNGVTILLGNGEGTFTPAPSQPSVTLESAASITAADFDGDGILDLAIADAGSTAVTVLKGIGGGTFTQISGEPALPQSSSFVTAADLNGDGKLDLLFSTGTTTSVLLGNGNGTFQPALSEAGTGMIGVADFNGDGRPDLVVTNSAGKLSILRQTVPALRLSVTLTPGQGPSYVDQPLTFTAAVAATPFNPTGSITFKQGSTVLGTEPLVNGQASLTTTITKSGMLSIDASYSGDQSYHARNSKAVTQIINKYAASIGLTSSPNPAAHGQPVMFTATVGSPGPLPTGRVVFQNGSERLGAADLVSGVATLTKSNLPSGNLTITATYEGDANSEKTTSTVLIQTIN